MQGRFSMHYCVALALLQDRLSLADFTPEAVGRAEVRRLLPLTTMRSYAKSEEAAGRQPHRVTITLKDGRILEAERREARGSIAVPFDDADRAGKFMDCCAGVPGADQLYARLADIDAAADLGFLLSEPAATERA
jgi:2-methylcitrate dehydratase PrpD